MSLYHTLLFEWRLSLTVYLLTLKCKHRKGSMTLKIWARWGGSALGKQNLIVTYPKGKLKLLFCPCGVPYFGSQLTTLYCIHMFTFTVLCCKCNAVNTIKTSKENMSGANGPLTFNVNTRAALGCLHTGVGNTRLNNLLSTLNVPAMNSSAFKNRKR